MLHDKTSAVWLSVSTRCITIGMAHIIGWHIVCRRIASIRLDSDLSITHLANPNVSEAPSIDGVRPDDFQVFLCQPPVTLCQGLLKSTGHVDECIEVCCYGVIDLWQ